MEPKLEKKSLLKRMFQKQLLVTISTAFLLIFILVGSSYAILNAKTETGLTDVVVQSGNLLATISSSDEMIQMNYTTLGVSDEVGLSYEPYTFTISNNGENKIAYYEIRIVDKEYEISTLPHKSLNYALSVNGSDYTNPQNLGDNKSYIYVGGSLDVGESDTFNLKLWVNEEFGKYADNKILRASIELTLYSDIPTRNYIIYDSQGGNYIPKTNIVSKRISMQKPIKAGYSFIGWSSTPDGEIEYESNAIYNGTNGMTLYAVWEACISYNLNGGIGNINSNSVSDGITTLIPTKEGFAFKGWSTNPNSVDPEYQSGDVYNGSTSVILYAIWGDLPEYDFADYYIIDQTKILNESSVPALYVSNFDAPISISNVIPDDVEYINLIDIYSLHNQGYLPSGNIFRDTYYIFRSNYHTLIDRNFCLYNPSVCKTYSKEEFSYTSHSWNKFDASSIKVENAIPFYYNSVDKKIYTQLNETNGFSFYLAIQFEVPGYKPSNWEHFSVEVLCLHSNTDVYVYDEKKKRFKKKKIKDVTYDDELLVWDFDKGEFATAKPLWIKKKQTTNKYNLLTFSDGSKLRTINQHRIFNKEKGMFTLCMTEDTPIGTTTYNSKGKYVKLVSKKVINRKVDYYNVITDYHINLFTDNILTSCRLSNIYDIKDMKYVNVKRDNSKYIKSLNIDSKWIKGLRLNEQLLDINKNAEVKYESIKDYINNLEKYDVNNN